MRRAQCDCCRTGTTTSSIDALLVAGWTLTESGPGEPLVLLCPVCTWQRNRASESVKGAVEAASPAAPPGDEQRARPAGARGSWFWA